jgi:hypothetical protein
LSTGGLAYSSFRPCGSRTTRASTTVFPGRPWKAILHGRQHPRSLSPEVRLTWSCTRTSCKPSRSVSGSVVEGAPTEEPRPDASNARIQRPATRATGVSRAFACVLNTRGCVVAHRCFTLPRSSVLCGCIKIPGRQVNAVWGRCPTACAIYVKKEEAWSVLGLFDKISPAFELRNLGVQPEAGPASSLHCHVCLWV